MTNISIKQTTPHISIRASGKQGPQGEKGDTGATGPQGPKGDPGTTDYNELENLPDLTLKADKVHTHVASDVTDFNSSVSSNSDVSANTAARHTHANKAILDATSAAYTTADKTKLDGIEAGAEVNTVTSVSGKTGAVTLGKSDVGLSNVDNTSDANKPISTATQTALDTKATTTALSAHTTNTSNPHSVTKAQVGLGNVDNTSDASKPVSTAQQAALDGKANFPAVNSSIPVRGVSGAQASISYSDSTTADSIARRVSGGRLKVGTAVDTNDAVPKAQMDAADALKVDKAGDTMTGVLTNAANALSLRQVRGATDVALGIDGDGNYVLFNSATSVNKRVITVNLSTSGVHLGDRFAPAALTGTGFPDGVVTAPVGSIYIDTAITNGASSWIKKSGTGNTGWQVLEGDTGWRNITSLLTNGWTATQVRVRRVGNQIFYGFENLKASTMTDIAPLVPPSGLRSIGVDANGIYSERQFLTTATNPAQVWRVTTAGTAMAIQGATTALASLYGSLSFITNDPYPTTLPGTAI